MHDVRLGREISVTTASKARQPSGSELARINDPYTAMRCGYRRPSGCGAESRSRSVWNRRTAATGLRSETTGLMGGQSRGSPSATRSSARSSMRPRHCPAGASSSRPSEAHHIHGHSHQHAQIRYRELTVWPVPAAGESRLRELTLSPREAKRSAAHARSWGTSASESRPSTFAGESSRWIDQAMRHDLRLHF